MLIVAPLGMSTGHPQEAGNRLCARLHETGGCPDATACIEMVDPLRSVGLRPLRVQPGGTAACRALLATGATAQQTETVVPIHFPDGEGTGTVAAKQLAFGIDTRESVAVGSFQGVLLENS